MAQYFISDLHLSDDQPGLISAFTDFIDAIQGDAEELYILGDFFDAWIGDDERLPCHVRAQESLRKLSQTGTQISIMHGNRDFLMGHEFAHSCAAELISDPHTLVIGRCSLLLMHGDSLCTDDQAYMQFRERIRNPQFLEPFLKRPIEERRVTAQQLRAMSKDSNSNKAEDIMDVSNQTVTQEMQRQGADILIHGHTHRPHIHNEVDVSAHAKRLVLGDWGDWVWFAKNDQNTLTLARYRIDQTLRSATSVGQISLT